MGVFACNRKELVDGILSRLQTTTDLDQPVELQLQKENHTSNGKLQIVSCGILICCKIFWVECRVEMVKVADMFFF